MARTFYVEITGIYAWPMKTRLENNLHGEDCPGSAFNFLEHLLNRINAIPTVISGGGYSLFLRFGYEHRHAVHKHLRILFNKGDADFCRSSLGLILERKMPVSARPYLVKNAMVSTQNVTEVLQ
jgi:hypothetical protein